jgi:signal transduction histidine kinase
VTPEEEYLRTGFLERIAHDARGAAGVSLGALDEIEAALGGRADLAPLLGIARRGLRRVLRIGESLAEAAELENGRVTVARSRVDLGKLAVEASEQAQALERRRGIVLESRCEPLFALVDGPRMARAIFELTSNAIRSARGKVTVETLATDDAITVTVSDDGPGCGQPAPRFTASLERRGLGLGLALAADVAALHGGQLIVGRDAERTSVKIVLARSLQP